MDPVFKGLQSLPKTDIGANSFKVMMWSLNGTIATPWFGEPYVEDYYKENHAFHFVLEFPGDVKDLIGSGTLVINVEVDIREETGLSEEVKICTYIDKCR